MHLACIYLNLALISDLIFFLSPRGTLKESLWYVFRGSPEILDNRWGHVMGAYHSSNYCLLISLGLIDFHFNCSCRNVQLGVPNEMNIMGIMIEIALLLVNYVSPQFFFLFYLSV